MSQGKQPQPPSPYPTHSANIDAAGQLQRRNAGIAMLVIAAATYIGLILPSPLDRRWLIISALPCAAGIVTVMQSLHCC